MDDRKKARGGKTKRSKGIRRLCQILLVCSLAVCAAVSFRLWTLTRALQQEEADLSRLAQIVAEAQAQETDSEQEKASGGETAGTGGDGQTGPDDRMSADNQITADGQTGVESQTGAGSRSGSKRPVAAKYRSLYEQNQDMAGWIWVDGTSINYPVMLTKNDPEYYIHRNFDRQYAYCGLPFLHPMSDPADSRLLMIYGHHMRNGSMFAGLMKFKDRKFGLAHTEVMFDDLQTAGTYRIFSAFYADTNAPADAFHYEQLPDPGDSEAVDRYIASLKAASLYDTGVTPEEGARVVILSTCSYHVRDSGRFVVAAEVEE